MIKQALVSVIIVGHDSKNDLRECLTSLKASSYRNFETLFVDNCSTDGSAGFVKREFPWVKVVQNRDNIGYGGGCNVGAKYAQGDFFVFLNPDTRVDRNWLKELLKVATADKRIGACGSTVLFWNGKIIQSLGGVYNRETGYSLDLGFGKDRTGYRLNRLKSFFHCCGVSLLVRAEVFRKVNGFANDYFLYFDEVDLCWRIRLIGYQVFSVPSSVVYHKISFKRAHSAKYRYLIEKNSLETLIKNYELLNLVKYGSLVIFIRLVACVLLAIKGKNSYSLAILKSFVYVVRNFRKIWYNRQRVQEYRVVTDKDSFKRHFVFPFTSLLHIFRTEVMSFLD
ncbi:glycosyltransferase family 2 protein [Candidatus Bathyarchaeota archaeon]|nr:glycosyltransferase family 2 protein [Candidatus Bathyarchaeota archaeon]